MKPLLASLTKTRRVFKGLKDATALPDPMRSFEDYSMLNCKDLADMDKLTLSREKHRSELMFLLLGDSDHVITVTPEGQLLTARTWLTRRLELINRALREAV